MAKKPTKLPTTLANTRPTDPKDKRKDRTAASEDVLMREVDEAVRKDELSDFGARYGKPILAVIVLGLAAFAGYLFWDSRQEAELEGQSESLVRALDQIEAGNLESGSATLDPIAQDGKEGGRAIALMLQAGIAQEQGDTNRAAELFALVAADDDTPDTMRDLAIIREVAATYDSRKPADIIARLKPLAVPGNPYFGSAGEMVAMAYLDQGKRKEAGTLFAEISKADELPQSLRARTRRMAGLLGVDAIEDVDELLAETNAQNAAAAAAQAGQPAPAPQPAQ